MSDTQNTRYGVLKVIEAREHYIHYLNGHVTWTTDRRAASDCSEFQDALILARQRNGLVIELDPLRPGEEQTLLPI